MRSPFFLRVSSCLLVSTFISFMAGVIFSLPLNLMTDALGANKPTYDEIEIKHGKCLTHGRRNFHEELFRNAPSVTPILETLKTVWEVDARCKREGITGRERMMLHREGEYSRHGFALP